MVLDEAKYVSKNRRERNKKIFNVTTWWSKTEKKSDQTS